MLYYAKHTYIDVYPSTKCSEEVHVEACVPRGEEE